MSKLTLLINEIKDKYIQENFKRLSKYAADTLKVLKAPVYETEDLPTEGIVKDDIIFNSTLNTWMKYSGNPSLGIKGWVASAGGGEGQDYVRDGYSARFSEAVNVLTVETALDDIFKFTSVGPTTALTLTPSAVREKGNTLASINLSAVNTAGHNPAGTLLTLVYKRGLTTIHTTNSPGGTDSYTDSTPVTDTTAWSITLTDSESRSGSSSQTLTFLYPILTLVGVQYLNTTQIYSSGTKILSSAKSRSVTYNTTNQVAYYAFPASLGALTSILDQNGFETIGDWTLRSENLAGLDGTNQAYYIYEFKNLTTTSMTYTFA